MADISASLKKIRANTVLKAVLTIAVGVLCVAVPESSSKLLCTILGVAMILVGGAALGTFLLRHPLFGENGLGYGIAMLISGIFFLTKTETVQGILSLLLGAVIIIDGCIILSDALHCLLAKAAGWLIMLIIGAVILLCGLTVVFDLYAVMIFVGISLIADGAGTLGSEIFFSRRIKEAKKAMEPAK